MTLPGILMRAQIVGISIVYWYGVFSGYYLNHPEHAQGPDAYVHSGVGMLSIILFAEIVQKCLSPKIEKEDLSKP